VPEAERSEAAARVDEPAVVSYVGALGISVWHEDGRAHGSVELDASMWAAGTSRPRVGVVAVLADFVISSPPAGVLVPTVDLRVELVDDLPPSGRLHATAAMLKMGRRLAVGEAWFDVDGVPCARATATFVNPAPDAPNVPASLAVAFPPGRQLPARPTSFDGLIGAVRRDATTMAVDPAPAIRNGPGGTVQGGIQATIAEIAAEAALGGSDLWRVVDIDVRYLGVMRTGPLLARSEVLVDDGSTALVRVTLHDEGDDDPDRLVAHVTTRCRRLPTAP
jgi:acyl-coenzyme A thioesterase PaaI-like protein